MLFKSKNTICAFGGKYESIRGNVTTIWSELINPHKFCKEEELYNVLIYLV